MQAGWRAGRVGHADMKRRGRAVQHVARELGVVYPPNTRLSRIASVHWHSPPSNVFTVLSARQGTRFMILQTNNIDSTMAGIHSRITPTVG